MPKAYSQSGVSLNRAYRILDIIEKKNSKPVSHFATVLPWKPGVNDGAMVVSADGVGTKIELLAEMGWDETSGWDCVAMNVNDILCQGARPLWFLDYFSQNKLDPALFERVLTGIKKALKESGGELSGGETAELPGMFAKDSCYELAGFVTGVQDKRWNLNPARVKPGNLLVGLRSSGPHSNGFSLIRKSLSTDEVRKNADALLAPTRLYHPVIWPLLKNPDLCKGIHAMAHITGGAFMEKLARGMNEKTQASVDLNSWEPPQIFRTLQERAAITRKEACGVWNMGVGLVLVIDAGILSSLLKRLKEAFVIGRVLRRSSSEPAVLLT